MLLFNRHIRHCKGPYEAFIILVAKIHQETITNIDDFVWRMCVSYCSLNVATRPFKLPNGKGNDTLGYLNNSHGHLWFISLDARSGYHQVVVRVVDQDKLAFSDPDSNI